ncbi:MAG: succinylglutamate desuccinylase/aspartoacylase family protein [Desulfobacula sp.]|nr:succinylglutamate desuccinylase/aspartoacylase family protein [Desulfobacula sp.]
MYKLSVFTGILVCFGILSSLSGSICLADSFQSPDFSIHKLSSPSLENQKQGRTVLIIGGIQGDEPGGFNAASLIVTQYKILSGNVWVVPNLNFLSIIKRSRGVYGDLNRKFDKLDPGDPEFKTINRIKKLIADPKVDLVLNLHDGSGFFRNQYIDKMQNPNRWGQCIIIDQKTVKHDAFPNLTRMAQKAADQVNQHLIKSEEHFLVNNTQTARGNNEMAKTLTWFSIKNKKPAFGIEASKSFLTPKRTYYHLRAIESFFNQVGIKFERNFKLTQKQIKKAIDDDIQVAFNNSKILLKIENARKQLNYIPLRKNYDIEFTVNNPLMAIIPSGNAFSVIHGNRRMTHLSPQYFDYDFSIDAIKMIIDDTPQTVSFGQIIPVKNSFLVQHMKEHRVNIIGFTRKGLSNESGVIIKKEQVLKKYSIDKKGSIFRVEIYKEKKFSGMILVDFSANKDSDLKIAAKNRLVDQSKKLF